MSEATILADGFSFPEGPAVAPDGAIWLSELAAGRIARVDPDGRIDRVETGGAPNGLAFAPDGSIWFCDQARHEVRRLDPSTGDIETVADAVDGARLAAPNDLALAPDGSFVFSCPGDSRREPTGYLCRIAPGGTPERIADGLLFPNGVCFSPGGDRLLVAETYGCRVLAGPWRDDVPVALTPLFDTPGPIGADGVAETNGGIVATCVHGAGVVRVLDRPGMRPRDVRVPDARPAGCAADPLDRWTLIVTGTERGVLVGLTL